MFNTKKNAINELIRDIALVDSLLKAPPDFRKSETERIMERMERLRFKAFLQADLNLYTKEEIREATKPQLKKPVVVFEEVEKVTYKEERGILWLVLMMIVNADKSIKNKAFLYIAIELFAKDVVKKLETEEIAKIKYQ